MSGLTPESGTEQRHISTMIAAHLQPESLPEPEPGRSLWQDARRRIRQNPVAMASFSILVLVGIFALFGPIFSNWSSEDINWNVLGNVETAGRPALDSGHYFGTDQLGRDLFVRTAHGVRVSMMVGIIGALIAIVVGTLYGTIAGYVGGRTDNIMMRTVDVIMSIPYMFLLIILLVMFGQSILLLFVGIGLVSWLDMARIVRGQTLSIKNREFVESAVVIGVPPAFIILRHILPNLVGVVIVYATLLIPNMIIFESFISFLGLGIQEPNTSLGVLISEGASQMQYGVLWQLGFPLFFFILIQFGFFFLGDGIRDALDPKDRH